MGKLTGNYFLWQTVAQWHVGMALVIVNFKHTEGVVSAFFPQNYPSQNTGVSFHFFFERSSLPRDQAHISCDSCIGRGFSITEPAGKPMK